ncbi:immunoglobulin superfamily member 5-like isoform X2 [Carassius carassius]|uniref:immunoglobulin superfamily member 5-like isoform X2 n=1 Tax=Carassius carassius TaxID=217509 RepID=UPI0028684217|nr:immunoglobulin superfamily member 5-like isoform X2 [Carassius carassius]
MYVFRLGLFLLIITVASGQVLLQPLNAAVLRGSKAQFNCSTNQPISVMTWMVNGRLVITISDSGVLKSTDRVSATNFTTPGDYRWEFSISNVQRDDAGEVTCQVLGGAASKATLSVQERGSVGIVGGNQTKTEGAQSAFQCQAVGWFPEPNVSWSVNGVANSCNTSSVTQGNLFNSSCTLLVTAVKNSSVQCLVKIPALSTSDSSTVFLTVESSYQEELRRAQIQSQNRTPATENVRGRDNRGYRDRHDGHTNDRVWYTNQSNKHQMPGDFFDDGHRNHSHMTML